MCRAKRGEASSCAKLKRAGIRSPFGGVPVGHRGAADRGGLPGLRGRLAAGAAEAEVEAAGMQRVEQPELLDGGQRGAVPELDRAGAEPDGGGRGGGQRQHHGRGGAGHAGVEVVLGEPVAAVAEPLGLPGEVDAVAQRLRRPRNRS